MADEYQRVVDLPVKTSSGISLLSDYLMGIDASDGYQMLLNDLAKKIVEDYVGSSLGGSSRSLKAALDAVNTKIGNDTMGTTASSVTGAIAEHESDINGTNGINAKIGNIAMGTTATTLTGAVKEHNDKIGSTTMGTTATTLTGAIAEHEEDISELNSNLTYKYFNSSEFTKADDIGSCTFGGAVFGKVKLVSFNVVLPSSISSVGYVAIGTLPPEMKPIVTTVTKGIIGSVNSSLSPNCHYLRIEPTCIVKIYANSATEGERLYINEVYI